MATKEEKFTRNRLRSSNITVVISISLILFLVGLIGMMFIQSNTYLTALKEQMSIEVFFKDVNDGVVSDKLKDGQLAVIQKLKDKEYTKDVKYISKEEASQIAQKDMGINSQELFEKDIFPASADLILNADYVDPDKVNIIAQEIKNIDLVESVETQSEQLNRMKQALKKITLVLIIFAAIILLIAISLINSSIRLKIYAKRFTIKTMQLVGATRFFIVKPFLKEGVWLGFLGACIATVMLAIVMYFGYTQDIIPYIAKRPYAVLIVVIFALGIIISFFSTLFATRKYLRLRLDDLYY